MMSITEKNIIGELVAKDYRTASVFKNYGVDFCCNGNRSIQDACKNDNIQTEALISELEQVIKTPDNNAIDYASWPLDLLADYIEKKHHRYIEQKTAEIIPYLEKITNVHGDKHPELTQIKALFLESVAELTTHMKKEELILFPFIRKMMQAKLTGTTLDTPHFNTVNNPIAMMRHEHDTEGERFRKIAALSNNYLVPADGCNTYKVTFALLKEFEVDLHLHIHLENNILFPKASGLEQALAG